MKYLVGYTDMFMSPLTGKLRSFSQFPSLGSQGYIIIGDYQGNAITSPALIDVRLDIIELRSLLQKLSGLKFILQSENFIAPNAQALNQLINGFLYNTGGVLSVQTPGSGNLSLQKDYVYVGDDDNIAQGVPTIKLSNIFDIPYKQFIMGNSSNKPELRTLIYLDNLFDIPDKQLIIGNSSSRGELRETIYPDNLCDLSYKKIWRGNISNRPEESDALTNAESSISSLLQDLANLASIVNSIASTVSALSSAVNALETGIAALGGFAAIALLQIQVLGLIGSVGSLSRRLNTVEGDITDIQGDITSINSQISSINSQLTSINTHLSTIDSEISSINDEISSINTEITTINTQLSLINARIDNLRLNTIPADGDVSFYNYKLINLADGVDPTDGVNMRTLEAAINDHIDDIQLDGFVEGDSDETGLIHTTRGPDCLLTNIPAGGDVDMGNYKISNLVSDDVQQLDALNAQFLWDLMHDNVGVVYV